MASPAIKRLELTRFRGFEELVWHPAEGANLILGGGDVGKSTLLDAISTLLHPGIGFVLSDADYLHRDVSNGFVIEAVLALPAETGIHDTPAMAWPWEWDGQNAVLPDVELGGGARNAVYRVRARGTEDLELVHEIIQPDGSTVAFSLSLRRKIGVVRLAGEDRSDRDLRLVHGGALDRLLDDRALRGKLGRRIAQDSVGDELADEALDRLTRLGEELQRRGLPHELGLGFVGSPGLSINALIGLTATVDDVALPVASWGAGTRRLTALAIADQLQDGAPITVIDEIERGLEPYRQRKAVATLVEKQSQSFVTTHSPFAVRAAEGAAVWYVDARRKIGKLTPAGILKHQTRDPETFLSRMTLVVEGDTELGFMQRVLAQEFTPGWSSLGLHITNGGGNDSVLQLLEALLLGGVRFAGVADREALNPHPQRWRTLKERLGDLLLQWEVGCLESNILPFFIPDQLEALISDPSDRRTGQRMRSLTDRLEIRPGATVDDVIAAAGDRITRVVIEAATGFVPADVTDPALRGLLKGHASQWFKSVSGGMELADKVYNSGLWPQIEPNFAPLLAALRATILLPTND